MPARKRVLPVLRGFLCGLRRFLHVLSAPLLALRRSLRGLKRLFLALRASQRVLKRFLRVLRWLRTALRGLLRVLRAPLLALRASQREQSEPPRVPGGLWLALKRCSRASMYWMLITPDLMTDALHEQPFRLRYSRAPLRGWRCASPPAIQVQAFGLCGMVTSRRVLPATRFHTCGRRRASHP